MSKGEDEQMTEFEEEVKEHGAKEFLKWLCEESSHTEIAQDGIVDELHGRVICIDDVIEEWRRFKKYGIK